MTGSINRRLGVALTLAVWGAICSPAALAATRTINFDGFTAPCNFADAPQLTDRYASMGVTFRGPAADNGGEILDQCGTFGVSGHSAPNFLAFNTIVGVSGPETVEFASPAHSVNIKAGQSGGGTITVTAFDGTTPVSQSFRTSAPALATLSVQAARITSLQLAFTGSAVVFDDLTWGTAPVSGDDSYVTPASTALVVPGPGVLVNDSDADGDALAATVTRQPANGTVALNTDGSFTYTPAAGFSGNDAFGYKAGDGTGTGNEATVTVRVEAPPAPQPAAPTPTPTVVPAATPPALRTMAVTVSYSFLPRRPKRTTQIAGFEVKNIPRGSRVEARCVTATGKKCKGKLGKVTTKTNVSGTLRVSGFKQKYPAGSQLEIIVTNPAYVTQVKIVKVIRNKVPSVTTRCQTPGTTTRRAC